MHLFGTLFGLHKLLQIPQKTAGTSKTIAQKEEIEERFHLGVVSPECARKKCRGPGHFGLEAKEGASLKSFHFSTCSPKIESSFEWEVAIGFLPPVGAIFTTTILQILKVVVVIDSGHR